MGTSENTGVGAAAGVTANLGSAAEMRLDPAPAPSMENEGYVIDGGEINAKLLWVAEDGTAAAGIWEATGGVIEGRFLFDENDLIISGRMTVTPSDGEPFEIRGGDLMHSPSDSTATWVIHEPVRKFFSMHNPEGLPL